MDAVFSRIIEHKLKITRNDLQRKKEELLVPYEKGQTITKNPAYASKKQEIQEQYTSAVGQRADKTSEDAVHLSDLPDEIGVAIRVQAYYEVSHLHSGKCFIANSDQVVVQTFIDNVVTLTIENCLVRELQNLLPETMALTIEDDMLELVASEPEHVLIHRERTSQRLCCARRDYA